MSGIKLHDITERPYLDSPVRRVVAGPYGEGTTRVHIDPVKAQPFPRIRLEWRNQMKAAWINVVGMSSRSDMRTQGKVEWFYPMPICTLRRKRPEESGRAQADAGDRRSFDPWQFLDVRPSALSVTQ